MLRTSKHLAAITLNIHVLSSIPSLFGTDEIRSQPYCKVYHQEVFLPLVFGLVSPQVVVLVKRKQDTVRARLPVLESVFMSTQRKTLPDTQSPIQHALARS